jgi:hypothetical protein
MQQESLTALVRHHLETAPTSSRGRNAHAIYGGHERVLRHTLAPSERGATSTSTKAPAKPPFRFSTVASLSWPGRINGTAHPVI